MDLDAFFTRKEASRSGRRPGPAAGPRRWSLDLLDYPRRGVSVRDPESPARITQQQETTGVCAAAAADAHSRDTAINSAHLCCAISGSVPAPMAYKPAPSAVRIDGEREICLNLSLRIDGDDADENPDENPEIARPCAGNLDTRQSIYIPTS